MGRKPFEGYPSLKDLVGRKYDDPRAVEYRRLFNNTMVPPPSEENDRLPCRFQVNDTLTLRIEALLAMQFQYIKEWSEKQLEEPVHEAILIIPSMYSQAERQTLLDAAEIAGLKIRQLMAGNTAVAVNYAMPMLSGNQLGPEPEHHIIFDMGAGFTVASVDRKSVV